MRVEHPACHSQPQQVAYGSQSDVAVVGWILDVEKTGLICWKKVENLSRRQEHVHGKDHCHHVHVSGMSSPHH